MTYQCNLQIYSKQAILKAAYCFTDRAYFYLTMEGQAIVVSCTAKPEHSEIVESEFLNELLSQSLREELIHNTKDIRKLIISRALASTIIDTVTRDKPDLNSVTDSGDDIGQVLTPWGIN